MGNTWSRALRDWRSARLISAYLASSRDSHDPGPRAEGQASYETVATLDTLLSLAYTRTLD